MFHILHVRIRNLSIKLFTGIELNWVRGFLLYIYVPIVEYYLTNSQAMPVALFGKTFPTTKELKQGYNFSATSYKIYIQEAIYNRKSVQLSYLTTK